MEFIGYMKYIPYYSKRIKKQLAILEKRGYDMTLFKEVVAMLASGVTLPAKYRDHPMQGAWRGYRDCHIQGDWVLIYRIERNIITLYLSQTGTHSDILE